MRQRFVLAFLFIAGIILLAGRAEALTVSVTDLNAEPGQTGMTVALSVDDAKGIAGGDLTLSYDAAALTARQVKGTTLVTDAGITVVPNLNTAGQVKVSMAGASGIASGSGALVTVTFDVKAEAAAGTYDLGLQGTLRDENGSAIAATLKKGTLTIKAVPAGPLTPKAGDGTGVLDLKADAGDQGVRTLGGVKAGQKVDVQVLLGQEVGAATGFQVVLKFDPKRLSVAAWKKDGTAFASAIDLPAQTKGDSVTYGASILGGTTTASGGLAVLTFEAAGDFSGETEVTLATLSVKVSGGSRNFRPGSSAVLSSEGGVLKPTPDFDGSGEVGFDDFFLFAGAFGQPATGDNAKFDLDADGEVGFGDFFVFAAEFGKKG